MVVTKSAYNALTLKNFGRKRKIRLKFKKRALACNKRSLGESLNGFSFMKRPLESAREILVPDTVIEER